MDSKNNFGIEYVTINKILLTSTKSHLMSFETCEENNQLRNKKEKLFEISWL